MEPDLVIVLGPRGLVSLVGIGLIIGGVWYADRSWDEKGSVAYKKALKKSQDASDKTPLLGVKIDDEELKAAFPFPTAFLLGWSLFGVSMFMSTDGSSTIEPVTWYRVVAALDCLTLGWIASIPMADSVITRNAAKKAKLSGAFLASWIVLVLVTGWAELTSIHMLFRAVGAICIIASMKVLWKYRKMGDSWEQQGEPNPNPVVYNIGGPLFVFGWFLFWFGTASTTTAASGIPLFFTYRSALAFCTGAGMVPIVMVVDYAHDEGAEFLGFGTDGRFFGRFWESPIPFVSAWTLFGLASFLPFDDTSISVVQWIILGNCILQGLVAGILIQTALYKGDLAGKTRWSVPFVLLFLALAAELGHTGGVRLLLSLPGALLIIAGQKTVFGDRKRGDYWMETGEVNPNPIVYSYGEPLFMTGWIMMSLVMSMPL